MHYIKGKWYFISWMENDENYNPIWNVNPTVHHIRWSPAGILEGRPRKLSKNRIMALIESGQIIQHFCWVANWLVRKREQCLLVLISFYIPGFDPIETRHRTRHFVHESHIYSWVSLKPQTGSFIMNEHYFPPHSSWSRMTLQAWQDPLHIRQPGLYHGEEVSSAGGEIIIKF